MVLSLSLIDHPKIRKGLIQIAFIITIISAACILRHNSPTRNKLGNNVDQSWVLKHTREIVFESSPYHKR